MYASDVRTNIDIDDELLAEAQVIARTSTKRDTVHFALREVVRRRSRRRVLELQGRVPWDGNLDELRDGRTV